MAVEEISVEEANRRRDEFHAIDVRGDHEYRGPLGHVRGAALVPLPELEQRARELPTGRPLLLICRSGVRSAKACEKLAALGIGPTLNLVGGMIAWNRAGLPLERVEPASTAELLDLVIRWVAQVGGQNPDQVRERFAGRIAKLDESAGGPSQSALRELLDFVEASLGEKDPPPDLALSIASFRHSLALL
jgi:rhodanese-related sulfurtransferase